MWLLHDECSVVHLSGSGTYVSSSLSHRLWLRSLAPQADPSASALTCTYAIHHGYFQGVSDGLFSAVCPCSNSGRCRQVPGIHFIWIRTVRIMMINIANPPVCFALGIRIAELIHWSFPRGFGESVQQNTEFISGSTGHWTESCLWCKIILLIAACLINPDFVSHKSSVRWFFLVSWVLSFDCEMQSVVSRSQA